MFENLESLLSGQTSLDRTLSGEPSSQDLLVAVLGLLLEAGDASGGMSAEELERVIPSMALRFNLADHIVGELVAIADFLRKEPGKCDRFISIINDKFSIEQKQQVLALIWRVFISDGIIDKLEASLGASLRTRLNLSLESALGARVMAEQMEENRTRNEERLQNQQSAGADAEDEDSDSE